MPFIDEASREAVDDAVRLPATPGERCYVYYKPMIAAWRQNRRWTTAHNVFKDMLDNLHYLGTEDRAAYQLAWQVFFAMEVMPYELEKKEENGDVG